MALSFFTPNRTVLLMSDDALYIYKTGARGVNLVEAVPWDADNFERNVANTIAKDCGKRPVLILNDMIEQHYRKERVLRRGVGVLDKSGMIRRKLSVAFPNYPVRAAFPLKGKVPKSDKIQAADIYIFAAIPGSDQFKKTVSSTRQSLASIAGFCLLPVESSDMVKTLSAKVSKGTGKRSKWAVFLGQHKNGGLRQIVTKDGELALTRMTLIRDDHNDTHAWAEDVHQEFKATMSYLSRFGYQPEDGLDVIVVGDTQAGSILENLIEAQCNYMSYTAPQAAKVLGLSIGRQEDEHYADSLHIAWSGRKSRFILPMQSAQLDQVSKPRRVAMGVSLLLLASAAFFGYQVFDGVQGIAEVSDDLDNSRKEKAQLDVRYQREVQRKEELGFDIRLIQSSIAVYDSLEAGTIRPLPIFKQVGHALGRDMRIDRLSLSKDEGKTVSSLINNGRRRGFSSAQNVPPSFKATMYMTYPSTTNVDRGNREVTELRDRIRSLLPDYDTRVTKFLKDYEYVEEIVVESGDVEREDINQDFVAEIEISGDLTPPPSAEEQEEGRRR